MWMLDNRTPYEAERTWVRDKNGVHQWIVVVKATYDIDEKGMLTLSKEPVEPFFAPEYNGEDGESSIKYEADMVAMKPNTDVILNGTAYAPNGVPAPRVRVSMEVGNIRKSLDVYGNRIWQQGISTPQPGNAEPFESMPIVYERAFGGFDQTDDDIKNHRLDPMNPYGTGCVYKYSDLYGQLAPNIQFPGGNLFKDGPAGFGAVPSFCTPRKEFAGTYDEKWQNNKAPLLPDDWDPRFLLSAPLDQRPQKYLLGGEMVYLRNMTPNGGLRFLLPRVYLTFRTDVDGKWFEHRSRLVTVVIEPEFPRVILCWQTSLQVRQNIDYLNQTVINEKEVLRLGDNAPDVAGTVS